MPLSSPLKEIHRQASVAGTFYPADPAGLRNAVKGYIAGKAAAGSGTHVRAIITPHAGYSFSGPVAGSAFAYVSDWEKRKSVFLIGSSHRQRFNGAALYTDGNFLTPIGEVKVDRDICSDLIHSGNSFTNYPAAHREEHSLEVQLPFLQYLAGEKLRIVPVLIGTDKAEECKNIASALQPWFTPENIFVFSSDFSHYPEYDNANKLDSITSDKIIKGSTCDFIDWIEECEKNKSHGALTPMCGWTSGLVMKYLAEASNKLEFFHLDYLNSGDSEYGDKHGVVGYHAIALVEEEEKLFEMDDGEKSKLLKLARDNITSWLKTGKYINSDREEYDGILNRKLGAFVTIKKDNKLRGCIGKISSDEALIETILQMSSASAFGDSRFDPIRMEELDEIQIEISVLSEMKRIENIDEIIPGKHGVYLRKGITTATFLPQVASEQKWTRGELLGNLAKNKAGLGWLGWKDADIYIYEAVVFKESR